MVGARRGSSEPRLSHVELLDLTHGTMSLRVW